MSGKVLGVYVLKQIDVTMENLKTGDLFRVKYEGDEGAVELSPWQVALTNAADSEDGVSVRADAVTFLVGRPDVVNLTMRKTGELVRKEVLSETVATN